MEVRGFWHLGHVSDDGLRRGLLELCASSCRIEARLVAHLAEVERRRLHLKDGFSSLQKYCMRKLGLSENVAFYRMTAARIALRFPIVFTMLEQGRIHLAGLCTLRDFLTNENHRELLDAAAGKSKARVLEELAMRFPRARIADSVRRLPRARVVPALARKPASAARPASNRPEAVMPPVGSCPSGSENAPVLESKGGLASGATPPLVVGRQVDVMDPEAGEMKTVSMATVENGTHGAREPASRSEEAALADVRYRVQFDASSSLKAKIELVKALSSHANPKGDLETLFERALDLYAEHLQKKRFGKTDKPREPAKRGLKRERAERFVLRSRSPSKRAAVETPKSREHIPNATRREVIERDGLQCAYVSETGERCDERGFLQMHHQHAWARNGGEHPDNLSVLCSNHNRFMAEVDFGAEHVARRIEESRSRHQPASGVELRAVRRERTGEKF